MSDDRLIDIEIKLTRMEDLLDTLNQTVFRQQERIAQLEAACATLSRRYKEVLEVAHTRGDTMPADEKPPHY